jgi:hypothetical protein
MRDANGVAPGPSGINLREFKARQPRHRAAATPTPAASCFTPCPWLSLSYNTSNNFQVNAGTRNVYGDLLPESAGQGQRLRREALLPRPPTVFSTLTHYTNSNENSGDSISNNSAGNFKQFDQLWIGVSNFTGDVKYLTSPYSTINTVWQDVVSTTSKGWEFSLTANATRPVAHHPQRQQTARDNTTSARGVYINQYMAEYLPIIKAHPEWLNLVTPPTV